MAVPDGSWHVPSTARGSISDWLALDDLTDPTTVAVSTGFDAAGRPTEVTWPEGVKLRSTWNAAGLLSKLEVDRGTGAGYVDAMTNAAYNARGQLTSHTSGNGAVTTRTYDDDLERLVRLVTTRTSGGSTTDFQDLGYDYDPAGNPVQLTDNLATSSYRANQVIPNTRTFRYDPRYRLVRATGKKHRSVGDKSVNPLVASADNKDYEPYTFRYSYDAVGNFTTNQEYAHGTNTLNYKATRLDLFNGDAGEATSTDPTAGNFRYDENGNTTKTPRITQLAYTMDNQARYADLGGGGQVRYLRHGDQRVVRVVNKTGVKALGVYLGPFEYHQRQGSTAFTKVVLHVSGALGRVAQVERVLAGSDPDALSVFYAHGDHLGSGQVLTKSDGTLLSQEEYFPYGRSSDRRDARNRYRFIGVETDEDTGLCMTGPRTYDPVSGRFLQVDPTAPEGSPAHSPFVYCRGEPVGLSDPTGFDPPSPSTYLAPSFRPEDATSREGRTIYERDATPEAIDFAKGIGGTGTPPSEIGFPEMLQDAANQSSARTELDPAGAEYGGIYYVTKSGREGFVDVGRGAGGDGKSGATMGQMLINALTVVPQDAIAVVMVHSHPVGDTTRYSGPSHKDIEAMLIDARVNATLISSARSGPPTGGLGSHGSTMVVATKQNRNDALNRFVSAQTLRSTSTYYENAAQRADVVLASLAASGQNAGFAIYVGGARTLRMGEVKAR